MKIRAVIIGAGGYSGAELVSLLLGHPHVDVVGLFGSQRRSAEQPVRFTDVFPRWRGSTDLTLRETDLAEILRLEPSVVFLATPAEVSHDLAPALLGHCITVFDLSGAFRLPDEAAYPKHYGFAHGHCDLLATATYGLPELHRDRIADASLVALPGCYPTSVILPLAPLVYAGAVDERTHVIVDSTSGVSGAGRSPTFKTHLCEVSLQPYAVLSHRHTPEIMLHCGTDVIFTPHLGAYERGILSTIHVQLNEGFSECRVRQILDDTYGDQPFVRLLDVDQWPSVAAVRGTNFCDTGLGVDRPKNHLVLVSAIDNLVKGAAGQAVQCMNLRFGISETTGILQDALCPDF